MTRMETQALTTLVDSAEGGGGYTLPAELLDAYRTYQRLKASTVDMPALLDADTAAARIVSAAAAGEDLDLHAAAVSVEQSHADRLRADKARELLGVATEQAANATALLASDLTERIITEHLRPAHADVLTEVRGVAADLAGFGLNPHALITAPSKVRNAYAKLPGLVARQAAILAARQRVNTIGHRKPQHDDRGLFANFRRPMTFHPHWRAPAPVPRLPFPEDATERLLWFVSEDVAKAEPWLPTIAEQDAAWWEQFGEGQKMRHQAARNTVAVGARIG